MINIFKKIFIHRLQAFYISYRFIKNLLKMDPTTWQLIIATSIYSVKFVAFIFKFVGHRLDMFFSVGIEVLKEMKFYDALEGIIEAFFDKSIPIKIKIFVLFSLTTSLFCVIGSFLVILDYNNFIDFNSLFSNVYLPLENPTSFYEKDVASSQKVSNISLIQDLSNLPMMDELTQSKLSPLSETGQKSFTTVTAIVTTFIAVAGGLFVISVGAITYAYFKQR